MGNVINMIGGGKPEQEKTVTAGTSVTEVTPDSSKVLSKVTVNPTPSQAKSVTPSALQQIVTPDTDKLLNKVTVAGDSDLVAGNIKKGVNLFGVNGSFDNSIGLYAWAKYRANLVKVDTSAENEWVFTSTKYTPTEIKSLLTPDSGKNGQTIFAFTQDSDSRGTCTVSYGEDGILFSVKYYVGTSSAKLSGVLDKDNDGVIGANSYTVSVDRGSGTTSAAIFFNSGTALLTPVKGDFVNYVVSDSEDTYPDKAVHTDGYYYEKVVEGLRMATGSFSWSSSTTNTMTFTHGLGVKPKYVLLYTLPSMSYGGYTIMAIPFGLGSSIPSNFVLCPGSAGDLRKKAVTPTITENEYSCDSYGSGYYWAADTYNWVAFY